MATSAATPAPIATPGCPASGPPWWLQPLIVVVVLTGFGIYATWAALQGYGHRVGPYLSPFYSPAIEIARADLAGPLDPLDPAAVPRHLLLLPQGVLPLVLLVPARLRRPRVAAGGYRGETVFPFVLSNLHRYLPLPLASSSWRFSGTMPSWPSLPRTAVRLLRAGHGDPAGQRDPALPVLALLPLAAATCSAATSTASLARPVGNVAMGSGAD